MHANLGDLRSRDRDLETEKNCNFDQKFINSLITWKLLDMECWNSNTTWVQMEARRLPSLRAPSYVTAILEAENRQRVD